MMPRSEILDFVEQASEQAAQKIAAIHRRRLVAQSFLAALVVALSVSIPVSISLSEQRKIDARHNALYNCHLLTQIAEVMGSGNSTDLKLAGTPEGLITSDAKLREEQQFDQKQIAMLKPGALKALFTDPETKRLTKNSQKTDSETTNYWSKVLVPKLESAAKVNCAASLKN